MQIWKLFLLFGLFVVMSCGDDDVMEDDDVMATPIYKATIMSPDDTDKKVGDMIHIHVNFDEENMSTIHHVNVRIYQKGDESIEIFNGPDEAHVHVDAGHYELHADVNLDAAAGVMGHTDWIIEAKIWGHEAGSAEVIETREFHVHPAGPRYAIGILSPDATDKKVGDIIHIHVNVDELDMETVHHVNVRIYDKADSSKEIFNGPMEAHVHEMTGHYELHADLELIEANGVEAHTDWVLEAKAWGHEAGLGEKVETLEFHVHPM